MSLMNTGGKETLHRIAAKQIQKHIRIMLHDQVGFTSGIKDGSTYTNQ